MEQKGITVLDALENGFINLATGAAELGVEQLANGITALKNGKRPQDVIQDNLDADLDLGFPDHKVYSPAAIIDMLLKNNCLADKLLRLEFNN